MPTATPTATRARVSLTPLPSLEDADLVRRARDGDDDAFEEIVRRYRAPLIRYSTRHVGRDHAEDITQHALASAALHLREDPRPIHLRAWLYRVAHNAAINMRQRKDWGHEQISPDLDGVPQPPDVAAQRSEVRRVVSDLDRLPDRQRTALLLSVFEGLGYEEIAARLDTTPNSVRALLSRARGHLRKAASAIAPIPLLQMFVKKISGLLGAGSAGGGTGGTIVAGGTAIQANLIAVAATAVTAAGAATAQNAISSERSDSDAAAALLVQEVPVSPVSAVTAILIEPSLKLSAILAPPAKAAGSAPPGPAAPALGPAPTISPIVPAPEVPAAEPPPAPPVEEAPPAEEPPAEEPAGDPAPADADPTKDDTTSDGGDPVDGDPIGDPEPPPGEEEDPPEDPPASDPDEPPPTGESGPPETDDSGPPATDDSTPTDTGDSGAPATDDFTPTDTGDSGAPATDDFTPTDTGESAPAP